MIEWSDEQLLVRLSGADMIARNKALKQLYMQHYPTIEAYVLKNSGSRQEAEDIFQDAMIVFYEKIRLKSLNLNCAIGTYLYAVSRNLWLNRLKRIERVQEMDQQVKAISIDDDLIEILNDSEKSEVLISLIEQLGDACKKILSWYYFDRIRMAEIATLMDYANQQVAKNKKASCMKKLKTLVLNSEWLKNILR